MKKLKLLFRVVFGRTAFVLLFLLIQVGFLFSCIRWLSEYLVYIYGGIVMLTVLVVVHILNEKANPSFKIAWMVPVLVIPVFGVLLYLFVQVQIGTKVIAARLKAARKETDPFLEQSQAVYRGLEKENQGMANLSRYVKDYGGFPVYGGTGVKYFPLGDEMFTVMKQELLKAKAFIFMEYFIIEEGAMWNELLAILEQKAKEGVEVRVMYDGMCSIMLLPYKYPKKLEKKGIRCKMFSPIKPTLSTHHNNRDHRKICVIDGYTAFTGGVNLADEYINRKVKFGHWKDTAVMLTGEGARSFTMMFLQMWSVSEWKGEDYKRYLGSSALPQKEALGLGYVMPYGDSPVDGENVGELVYMDILNQAKEYVHIMTPYLILDNEMVTALTFAAKRGVEVVIIMPHIPDKLYAYLLARSYYQELVQAGVKIYEYTPGFVHAKVFVSDNQTATVGTINLDFRSLYLHFECGVLIHKNEAVEEIEKDYQETLKKCCRITEEDIRRYPFVKSFAGKLMRFIAPLM